MLVAAAGHVIGWSDAHRDEAGLLLHGAGEFDRDAWPAALRERVDGAGHAAEAALRAIAARMPVDLPRALLAAVDVPYAMARRRLLAGAFEPGARALAETAAPRDPTRGRRAGSAASR